MLKIASWNVNGIRACHKTSFMNWIKDSHFDLIGLQEVRAEEEQIPEEISQYEPYSKMWFSAQKKGYSGVGILSKVKPLKIVQGMKSPEFDIEGRVITAEFEKLYFVSAYFPNSQDGGKRVDYKIKFCDRMHKWVDELRKSGKPVVLCGDFNIAHQPIDLARPNENEGTAGYLPQEREWMEKFIQSGWADTFRTLNPKTIDRYSWWSMRTRARERNIGWRIDYHTTHKSDVSRISKADIQDKILGSDHCPVTLEFDAKL